MTNFTIHQKSQFLAQASKLLIESRSSRRDFVKIMHPELRTVLQYYYVLLSNVAADEISKDNS